MFTSISFLLSFLFKIMMSLYKKSVHSFLGFSNSKDNLSSSEYLSHRNHHPPSTPPAAGGLTFFSVSENVERPVNVLESATIKKLPPPTTTSSTDAVAATTRANPGGSGFKKPPPPTSPTVVVAATRGGSTIIGFKEQPPLITTTTTDEGYPGGSGFPKPPLPTSETTTTTTHVDVATTKGYLGGSSCFPKPFPTTSGFVATTTKSDPGGTDFRKTPPSLPRTTTDILESTPKRDPGSIGFLDEVGGSVDGLMSCTEGLGFESSDERRVDDQILNTLPSPLSSKPKKTIPFKQEVKKFPPPLSSLNNNGQPKSILRPVRKEGRLELTEVKIHPPDILHASRQDGRLRLRFVFDKEEEAENQIEEEKQVTIQEDAKEFQENVEEEKLEGERVEEEGLKIPVMGGGGDGFRLGHELVASHHCRRHHVWSQRCVTIA